MSERGSPDPNRPCATIAAIVLIVCAGAAARLWNLSWGLPYQLMSDETIYMGHALHLEAHGGWDPGSYSHSHLLATQDLVCRVCLGESDRGADPAACYRASRAVTVLVSLSTVVVLWLLGRGMGAPSVGLFAAGLLALNPLHVAQGKLAVPDAHLAFFTLAALGLARRAVQSSGLAPLLLSAFCVGMAASSKFNGAFAGVAPGVALLLLVRRVSLRRWTLFAFATSACAGAAFFLGDPYAVLHPKQLYIGLHYAFGLTHAAHFWQAPESALREYGSVLGPEVGLAGLLGGAWLWVRSSSEFRRALLPELTFVAFFFAYMAHAPLHFPRFILPIVAPLFLYASWGSAELLRSLLPQGGARRVALLFLFVLLAARGTCALVRTELQKGRGDTRVQVSRWAESSLPEGTRIASEWHCLLTPGLEELRDAGLDGLRLRDALLPFGGKGLSIVHISWAIGEHPLEWYRENGIEYIVVNEEIRERVFRDPSLRPMQQNYNEIQRDCALVTRFEPRTPDGIEIDGPAVSVYAVPR